MKTKIVFDGFIYKGEENVIRQGAKTRYISFKISFTAKKVEGYPSPSMWFTAFDELADRVDSIPTGSRVLGEAYIKAVYDQNKRQKSLAGTLHSIDIEGFTEKDRVEWEKQKQDELEDPEFIFGGE